MRPVVALLLFIAACGSDVTTVPDLAAPADLSAPPDLNLAVCDCLQQLCAVPCSQYVPGMFPTLGCDRCLHNGQQLPDAGACIVGPGQCGACYGIPGCIDQRF